MQHGKGNGARGAKFRMFFFTIRSTGPLGALLDLPEVGVQERVHGATQALRHPKA